MTDGRVKVAPDDETSRRLAFVCKQSGRKESDVRNEAFRLGMMRIAKRYGYEEREAKRGKSKAG